MADTKRAHLIDPNRRSAASTILERQPRNLDHAAITGVILEHSEETDFRVGQRDEVLPADVDGRRRGIDSIRRVARRRGLIRKEGGAGGEVGRRIDDEAAAIGGKSIALDESVRGRFQTTSGSIQDRGVSGETDFVGPVSGAVRYERYE